MKNKKVLVFIAVVLVFSIMMLVGCGQQKAEAPKAADQKADAAKAEAPKAEEKKAEEPKAKETKASGKKLTYGYVTPGPDTWYKKDVEGFQYGAGLAGVDVTVLNSDYNVEKEIANIDSLINQGVDGMCVFTFNESGANIAAKKCAAAGVPLVVTDNVGQVIKQGNDVVACIDFDWKAMGNDWAEYIAKNFPGEDIALITGLFEHIPVQMYRSTFEPKVKELGKNKIVAIRDGKYNPEEAVKQAQDLIESGLKFSVLFVGNEDMAAGVIRMLESRKLLNNPIKVISENGSPVGVPLVKDGKLNYTISSSPGWEGMISFLALHAYTQKVVTKTKQQIMLPITPVNKNTIDDPKKVIPWEVHPVWKELTKEFFPQYTGLYNDK